MIVLGIILCTAAHGADGSIDGFFWMFTICRGITGIGGKLRKSLQIVSSIKLTVCLPIDF